MAFIRILGKAFCGLTKGLCFFLQHGGAESFQVGMNKLGQVASNAATNLTEKSRQESEDW